MGGAKDIQGAIDFWEFSAPAPRTIMVGFIFLIWEKTGFSGFAIDAYDGQYYLY